MANVFIRRKNQRGCRRAHRRSAFATLELPRIPQTMLSEALSRRSWPLPILVRSRFTSWEVARLPRGSRTGYVSILILNLGNLRMLLAHRFTSKRVWKDLIWHLSRNLLAAV